MRRFGFSGGARVITFSASTLDVNLRSINDAMFSGVGGSNLICTIEAGVIIGASSTGLPAFDVGSWPANYSIKIIVHGRIQGRGGKGGGKNDGGSNDHLGKPGWPGGLALYIRYPVVLDGAGEIWGGGGGGGSGKFRSTFTSNFYGGGGGGGAGTNPGLKGTKHGGSAQDGQDGTSEAGGDGGSGMEGRFGGDGGGPGLSGQNGYSSGGGDSTGGAAGNAIDGVSYITAVGSIDTQGPQI